MRAFNKNERVSFTYRNYRGEISTRIVFPLGLEFKRTVWHGEPQWILDGMDVVKQEIRSFTMQDISNWAPCPERL